MTLLPPGVKVHLAFGHTDMRKGIDGLAMLVQGVLRQDLQKSAAKTCYNRQHVDEKSTWTRYRPQTIIENTRQYRWWPCRGPPPTDSH